jgi:hypothetical protein
MDREREKSDLPLLGLSGSVLRASGACDENWESGAVRREDESSPGRTGRGLRIGGGLLLASDAAMVDIWLCRLVKSSTMGPTSLVNKLGTYVSSRTF